MDKTTDSLKNLILPEELLERIARLENQNAQLHMQNAELQARLGWYEEQFRLGQQRRYGASSERTPPEQLSLVFNEVEATAEPTEETITYKRRKRRGSRNETLENLPVEVVEHRLDESEQICPCCNEPLHEIGAERRREIEVTPAQVRVKEHVCYKYGCRRCDKEGTETPI